MPIERSLCPRLYLWRWYAVLRAVEHDCAVVEPLGDCGVIRYQTIAKWLEVAVWTLCRFATYESVDYWLIVHDSKNLSCWLMFYFDDAKVSILFGICKEINIFNIPFPNILWWARKICHPTRKPFHATHSRHHLFGKLCRWYVCN